jgi:SAM-dependent methyltransferase
MRDENGWRPTRIVEDRRLGGYTADPAHLPLGSRFVADIGVPAYTRVISEYAHGALLDCGCGDVPYFEVYRGRVSEVVCVDRKQGRHVDQRIDLTDPLPFPDERFDTVLLADVLTAIPTPDALVAELARILRPRGVLLVSTPFLYSIFDPPHDYYRYTEFALRRFCEANGLDVVQLEPYGGYPDVLLDLLNKRLVVGERSARIFVSVARLARRTRLYERLRLRTRMGFPLGYVLVAKKQGAHEPDPG